MSVSQFLAEVKISKWQPPWNEFLCVYFFQDKHFWFQIISSAYASFIYKSGYELQTRFFSLHWQLTMSWSLLSWFCCRFRFWVTHGEGYALLTEYTLFASWVTGKYTGFAWNHISPHWMKITVSNLVCVYLSSCVSVCCVRSKSDQQHY